LLPFGSADPPELNTASADFGEVEQIFYDLDSFLRVYITFQVMAVAKVSPEDEDAIKATSKRFGQIERIHPSRAHRAQHPDCRRVLKTGHTSQVRSCV